MKKLNGLKIANQIAHEHKGKCLSSEYKNNYTNMIWQCRHDHIWKARLQDIKNKSSWCPYCSNLKFTNPLDLAKKIASNYGGKCLSKKYTNNHTKMQWICQNGHIFESRFKQVKNKKQWCPECIESGEQSKLRIILQAIFPNITIKSNYRKLQFLKNPHTGYNFEIDIWIPKLKLAIEYDGEQHFKATGFHNSGQKLLLYKKRDKIKSRLISQAIDFGHINYFIRFNYKEDLTEEYVKDKLITGGIKCT